MSLTTGARLGPYVIDSPLGAGGMGEVYKARDTRLDRTVAIKVLSTEIAADAALRERFDREARTISMLDHPHICALYDVGQHEGTAFLVMQYLEGETLAVRLKKSAMPAAQALEIAMQIADALDKAHRAGIVHRDLKPGNIMLTKSGAKLLDFGLAKAVVSSPPPVPATLPTTPAPLTAQGTILGTLHYMAPEQVEGREADARSDIWALGCVLYEMVTGRRPFDGASHASVITAIMSVEPKVAGESGTAVPALLERVIVTCLAKNPEDRWQSARDLAQELRWSAEELKRPGTATHPPPRGRLALAAATALLAGAIGAVAIDRLVVRSDTTSAPLMRFSVPPPAGAAFTPTEKVGAPHLTLSRDGMRLAFVAAAPSARPMVWLRAIDSLDARVLPGTEDASFPFWSPDGGSIAFFSQGRLKRVDLAAGAVRIICDAAQGRGGAWNRDDTIIFAANINDGLFRVPASGGSPTPVTRLDDSRGETSHRWPDFLEDDNRFVYFVRSGRSDQAGIYLSSLDGLPPTRLLVSNEGPAFVAGNHLLAVQRGALMAWRIDPATLGEMAEPRIVAERVAYSPDFNYAAVSVSHAGVIAYGSGILAPRTEITWVSRTGEVLGTVGPPGEFTDPALAFDDRSIAAARFDPQTGTRDIWLFGVRSPAGLRFTFDPADDAEAMWSPGGDTVAFRSTRAGHGSVFEKIVSGATGDRETVKSLTGAFPTDWSGDGSHLVYQSPGAKSGWDLWVFDRASGASRVFLQTPFNEMHGRLSPDRRWMAYSSDESGRREIYVQPFPPTGGKWQVSPDGGAEPRWRRDGKELFFIDSDRKLAAVALNLGTTFDASPPSPLFQIRTPVVTAPFGNSYAVSSDGRRFVLTAVAEGGVSPPIAVIVNWPRLLGDGLAF